MVTRLSGAVLEIDAFGTEGVFRLLKDFERTSEPQRRFVVGDRAQLIRSMLERLSNAAENLDFGEVEGGKRGFYIDSGSGAWEFQLNATLSETPVGDGFLQMGDTGDPDELTKTDATGADPRTQADVFERFAVEARTDSESPARLHISNWHDGTYTGGDPGLFESSLPVVIPEGPRVTATSEESSSVDISVTCVVAMSAENPLDGQKRRER
jgi:hypothetical protein